MTILKAAFIICLLLFSRWSFGQIPDSIDWENLSKKEKRQLRKEIKKQQDLENLEVVKEVLESRQWILHLFNYKMVFAGGELD